MKKFLKIGLFVEHYEPFVSGVVTYVKALKAELERRGHTVYVICPSVGDYKSSERNIIRIPGVVLKGLDNTSVGIVTPAAYRRVSRLKLDIVHSHEVFFLAALAQRLAKKQHIPYVQNFHTLWDKFAEQATLPFYFNGLAAGAIAIIYPRLQGLRATITLLSDDPDEKMDKSRLSKIGWRHMKILADKADAVIVPSVHLKERFVSDGVQAKINFIPNGVRPFKASAQPILPPPAKGQLRMLCVARLSAEKRVSVLLEAVSNYKNSELILVGDGPDREKLEELALKYKLGRRIRFMGQLDNLAVRQLMSESDILALASYNFDNQPMVFDEALAAGLPVIYCDPLLGEGLSTSSSILVSKDAGGFAEGLKKINKPKTLEKMGKASKSEAKRFEIKTVADQVLSVYNSLLPTARQPRNKKV